MLLRLSTSISDTRAFPARAAAAAQDEVLFARFKRDPEFRVVIENLTCEHGRYYLDTALRQTPWLAGQLDRFRENDRIGSPQVCDYGDRGSFSPTTLRYVKVLSDLSRLFGSLEGARIVEIGGGYGGQCYVISAAARPGSYTLVDLEPVLILQRRYLKELGVTGVRLATAEELEPACDYDLVISNYAFSECTRPVQQRYIEQILAHSARGYITCNWFLGRLVSMTPAELLAAVPGARYVDDGPRASIMLWGEGEISDAREQPVDLEESAGSQVGKARLEPQ